MRKLLELISDDQGRLSRTQTMSVVCFLFIIGVIVAHIVKGNVLTTEMFIALVLLCLFCLIARMEASYLHLNLSKSGAQVKVGTQEAITNDNAQ